jgi:hypothetical protein
MLGLSFSDFYSLLEDAAVVLCAISTIRMYTHGCSIADKIVFSRLARRGDKLGTLPGWRRIQPQGIAKEAMDEQNDDIPAEARHVLERFALDLEAELAELDGEFGRALRGSALARQY